MREAKVNLYKFDELSDEARWKAVDEQWGTIVHDQWWDFEYKDAEEIGFKITSFDLDRDEIEGEFTKPAEDVAKLVTVKYRDATPIHMVATTLLATLTEEKDEDRRAQCKLRFKRRILACFKQFLQATYNYSISEEAIIDTIIANDYEFTVDGRLWPQYRELT